MASSQLIHPIPQGYAYALRVRITGGDPAFPAGCVVRADVRASVDIAGIAGSLSTEDGSLVRIDDDTIEMRLTPAMTLAIANEFAVVDFARIDLSPPLWVGVFIQLPVIVPVTAP